MPFYLTSIIACNDSENNSSFEPPQEFSNNDISYQPSADTMLYDLDSVIETCIETKKPLVLIFGGYAFVADRKLETSLYSSSAIQALFKRYTIVHCMVDSKHELNNFQKDKYKTLSEGITSRGKYYSSYQRTVYKSNMQPFIIIYNANGEKIDELDYSNAQLDLKRSLEKGLE